ncbi:MAG: radical SAM protein [Planctomycetota bacterium]
MENERFLLDPCTAGYLALLRSGELAKRAETATEALRSCRLCPRGCGVDRAAGNLGFCLTGPWANVTSAFPHHGEEEALSGRRGSGTIFFNRCNLRCVFCQNSEISQAPAGVPAAAAELAELMLGLQAHGCHNINFVTPTHVLPQILEALVIAAMRGLHLPLVWNSGGYDAPEALALLDGIVDIYMPDFKFWEPATAKRLANAEDYPARAREALREMHRQTGVLCFGPGGLARRGVLVRHLVMPGLLSESREIFKFLSSELSPDIFVNIMAQYHPDHHVGTQAPDGSVMYPEINRRVSREEMAEAYACARDAGLWRFDT